MSATMLRSLLGGLSLTPSMSSSIVARSAIVVSSVSPAIPSSFVAAAFSTKCTPAAAPSPRTQWCHQPSSRSIHTTATALAKSFIPAKGSKPQKMSKKKKRKGRDQGPDPRIRNLKISMSRKVPAPLRFARNRALRHWTIHRAWLLFQRKERERRELELEQMYRSMYNACEELRHTSGPGTRDEGFLYRIAMEKHGMYGHNAIPIEYARPQTETPARQVWNHEWTR